MENNDDYRSNSAVKNKFKELLKQAYGNSKVEENVKEADICVILANGEKYYFELKKATLGKDNVIFGSATLTEWRAARENSGHYFFVIAIELSKNKKYDFHIITPEAFMKYSYIPPFKVYFNIPFTKKDNGKNRLDYPEETKTHMLFKMKRILILFKQHGIILII